MQARDNYIMEIISHLTGHLTYKNLSRSYKHLVVNGEQTFFTNEETSAGKKYDETLIC